MEDNSGWIEWRGGECPVPHSTIVDVRHADGTVSDRVAASDCYSIDEDFGFDWWAHIDCLPENEHGFITAYRVVQP